MNKIKIKHLVIIILSLTWFSTYSQGEYSPSSKYPFGRINPDAPKQLLDYASLIGTCDCMSMQRNAKGEFADTVRSIWTFRYIMNGMAVQDETYKDDGKHTTSIRQFNTDSLQWYVTFFSSNTINPTPQTWSGIDGVNEKGELVLRRPQKAPNGMDGFSKLTFYDISDKGFKWTGQWVDPTEQYKFPFWIIDCTKIE